MNEKEQRKYWQMFNDGWQLFKEFSSSDVTEEFWQQMRNQAVALENKHNNRLMVEIAAAVMCEIEAASKLKG